MPVVALRPPASNVSAVYQMPPDLVEARLPFVENSASAGFPSPAGDYVESTLDLNEHLIRNKPATFFIRFAGDSLEALGILDGDVGAVDRSISPVVGDVVIASVDDEIVAKVFEYVDGRPALVARNDRVSYPPIFLDKCQEYTIWGSVYSTARVLKRGGR